tara:strand:- start:170152 stop:170892 length:741 start_codon:yes stop_codon:yes gene_type:complete
MELKRKPRGDKTYRGSYKYLKGETVYCEEEFEVYRDRKELGMSFFSIIHSRVATGELLTYYIDYQINKEYIPQSVYIEKTLGKEVVTELYTFNSKNNVIDYIFINAKGKKEHKEFITSPKFFIATPAACTSMIFLKSKKEDTTSKNFYNIISSRNQWDFKATPTSKSLGLERISASSVNINIEGSSLQAIEYKIFDPIEFEEVEEQSKHRTLRVHVSKFATIPYIIKSDDGIKIQVKYLNDLDKDA